MEEATRDAASEAAGGRCANSLQAVNAQARNSNIFGTKIVADFCRLLAGTCDKTEVGGASHTSNSLVVLSFDQFVCFSKVI